MNILFITGTYKPAYIYGGPTVVIALLAESLAMLGHTVTVYTTTANGKEELDITPNEPIHVDGVTVTYFTRNTKDHTHVSLSLWKHLNSHVKGFDVVHIHSWWNFLAVGAAYVCLWNGVVPILSPHGMFSPYILQTNNPFVKKALHFVIGRRLLSRTILHVSSEMELRESRQIIPGWQGKIISNLVVLSPNKHERQGNEVFTIGFLSRIDPKKGLDILIKALSRVNFSYRLLIAGSGDEDYIQALKQMTVEWNIDKHVDWAGWKKGEEKFDFLSQLDLFVLTSHSENFAIVVIESLSVGTPVMISDQVGLADYVRNHNFGWITNTKEEDVANCLSHIYQQNQKRDTIQRTAPEIIAEEYDVANLTRRYVDFYNKYKR